MTKSSLTRGQRRMLFRFCAYNCTVFLYRAQYRVQRTLEQAGMIEYDEEKCGYRPTAQGMAYAKQHCTNLEHYKYRGQPLVSFATLRAGLEAK